MKLAFDDLSHQSSLMLDLQRVQFTYDDLQRRQQRRVLRPAGASLDLIGRISLEQKHAARLQPRSDALVHRRAERFGEVNEDGTNDVERIGFGVEILQVD